jgi:hypothetical protein
VIVLQQNVAELQWTGPKPSIGPLLPFIVVDCCQELVPDAGSVETHTSPEASLATQSVALGQAKPMIPSFRLLGSTRCSLLQAEAPADGSIETQMSPLPSLARHRLVDGQTSELKPADPLDAAPRSSISSFQLLAPAAGSVDVNMSPPPSCERFTATQRSVPGQETSLRASPVSARKGVTPADQVSELAELAAAVAVPEAEAEAEAEAEDALAQKAAPASSVASAIAATRLRRTRTPGR